MKHLFQPLLLGLAATLFTGAAPAQAQCADGLCTRRMTADDLLRAAEQAVISGRYDEARPMLAALAHAPELSMQRHFLLGYMATRTNDMKTAETEFRAVLRERPDMTRARLELARVMMIQGKDAAADHHFRLAEQDGDLPPEIEKTIRQARGIIRSRRNWSLNVDVGLVPDSNINNATDARTISFDYGSGPPQLLELNDDARRRSGVGQSVGANGSVRLRLKDGLAMVVDGSAQLINHKGTDADDISALLAAGPELTMTNGARIGIQALGFSRWFGGTVAQQGLGVRLSYQQNLSQGQRIGALFDVRHVESGFSSAYDGESYAGYLTYERVVNRAMVASFTLFGRREDLTSEVYSSTEFGASLALGGELPHGINAGVSAGLSRARYDEPLFFPFGPDARRDWRYNARAYLGLRSIRVLGFSPSVTYNFSKTASNINFYDAERHRVEFALARYF